MHTWHFSLRGPPDSEFQEGVYHGKIIFPYDYPHSPPDIYFLSVRICFHNNLLSLIPIIFRKVEDLKSIKKYV